MVEAFSKYARYLFAKQYRFNYHRRVMKIITEIVEKPASSEADGKCPDARLPKSRGMRRTI
jgi:hypothetical protein